jgi:hypothetical protein
MSPPGILLDSSRHEILVNDDDLLDEIPARKIRIPLREQYNFLHSPATNLGANIDWVPSLTNYRERVARRLKEGIPGAALPSGFPKRVSGPACWSAADINPIELIRTLSNDHIVEMENALDHFKGLFLNTAGEREIKHTNAQLFRIESLKG